MRRILGGIGAVLVAAALAAGSGANYQSTSATAANIIKAGVVTINSSKDGVAVLDTTGLVPGKSVFDTVTVTNSGDLAATLSLKASGLVDTPASPAFSAKLDLKVENTTAGTTLYNGKLGSFTEVDTGSLAVGASRAFKFTVTFPDGGLGADNAYQGARSVVNLTWTAAG
jgi:hypothetical protein